MSLAFAAHAEAAVDRLTYLQPALSFRIQQDMIVVTGSTDHPATVGEIQHELYRAKIAFDGSKVQSELYKVMFSN